MKKVLFIFLILILQINVFAQKSIIIENKEHAGYERVKGTAISIVPPEDYIKSERFHGYEYPIANSTIMIFKAPGSVQNNFVAFKKNRDVSKGMVVANETMYEINGYKALLQAGIQFAYGKTYMKYVFVIGDQNTTYVINAAWIKDDDYESEADKIKKSLLSVIFEPKNEEEITEAFDFTVDNKPCELKAGNILMSSLVFTDDGNMPSKTDAKTAFMVNKSTIIQGQDYEEYLQRVIDEFPLEFGGNQNMKAKTVKIDDLDGLEIFGIGRNTKTGKSELLYIVVLFDETTVYQLTGTTLKYYEENLDCFKKTARSFKKEK